MWDGAANDGKWRIKRRGKRGRRIKDGTSGHKERRPRRWNLSASHFPVFEIGLFFRKAEVENRIIFENHYKCGQIVSFSPNLAPYWTLSFVLVVRCSPRMNSVKFASRIESSWTTVKHAIKSKKPSHCETLEAFHAFLECPYLLAWILVEDIFV